MTPWEAKERNLPWGFLQGGTGSWGKHQQEHSPRVPAHELSISGSAVWHTVPQRLEQVGDNVPRGNEELQLL